ncbi:hypothetical protein CEXT_65991 [Caerostris extrusa]|uniref:Uncharacterized protein n=1 Tax=Caerostris extrusa TaxID=172846 RepID=A0AAV4V412_CAEEX|nr:hypothetical protein CEXT_65991 [Caerostris extrusa]
MFPYAHTKSRGDKIPFNQNFEQNIFGEVCDRLPQRPKCQGEFSSHSTTHSSELKDPTPCIKSIGWLSFKRRGRISSR